MNNRKLAVFVEGQTELIFVREFLKQWYNYDANMVGFDCYKLLANEFCDAEYRYGNEESENYFFIVNVGNDGSVLSSIKKRMVFTDDFINLIESGKCQAFKSFAESLLGQKFEKSL